MRINGKYKV